MSDKTIALMDKMFAKQAKKLALMNQGNRRTGHGAKQRELPMPTNASEFIRTGCMFRIERRVAFDAAQLAIEKARWQWLPKLRKWRDASEHAPTRALLGVEIKRLQRALKIPPTDDERRTKTRERVRRHRAKS